MGQMTRPLVLVSHRGPVEYRLDDDGRRYAGRGGGGLVTALSGLAVDRPDVVWVAAAIADDDKAVAAEHDGQAFTAERDGGSFHVRFVENDPEAHHRFYAIIANPILWFIQHYLWDLSNAPDIGLHEKDAFVHGYVTVNEQFADAVADEVARLGNDAVVMMHDYHFYLLPAMVRKRCPGAILQHFIHIPWPQPDAWRVLPTEMRSMILEGALGNDLIAFHTERSARNFLLTCQELLDLEVSFRNMCVLIDGRQVAVRWYPISIDVADLERLASSPEVRAQETQLEARRREHLIVRVDRTDLSKNILRGFKAFDALLQEHPELLGEVTFLAHLQPSRQDVPEYVEYVDQIKRLVADINLKHGTTEWQPIDLQLDDDFFQALAAYKQFDVLLVNSIYDGMNLVAKEGVLVNERNGVLVLSENTGVHDELGAFALDVNPFDISDQAEKLYAALTMAPEEKRARRGQCVAVVRENDLSKWLERQLADIAVLDRNTRPAAD
ncbi:MAG: trehalose-6-phosphate synthase [Acidimicrobiia bacterium]|nr:trehalose-6-phosphate synthase [Acidimicrobiia bacterium]